MLAGMSTCDQIGRLIDNNGVTVMKPIAVFLATTQKSLMLTPLVLANRARLSESREDSSTSVPQASPAVGGF